MRELIAAYTSKRNHVRFESKSHAAVAAELLGDEALVRGVMGTSRPPPLDEKHKALFRFVDKVNHDSPTITPADLQALAMSAGPTRRCTSPSLSVRSSTSTTGGSTPAVSMPCRTRPTAREASARRRTDTCGADAAHEDVVLREIRDFRGALR